VKIDHVSRLLYFLGSLLVFGSWVDILPTSLGWTGWLMALVGWAVGSSCTRSNEPHTSMFKAEQIERLDLLRQRNVITEEDFQQEKRRLLDQPS
jgi:Short C-terminal domain